MDTMIDKYTLPLRAADAEGGADGGGAAPADAATGEPPVEDAAGTQEKETDPAVSGQPVQPKPAAQPPEGLDPALVGKTDAETIANLTAKLAEVTKAPEPKETEAVAAELEAYGDFSKAEVDDTIRPMLEELKDDPVFKPVAEKAKELGMPVDQMQAIVLEAYQAAAKGGLFEPVLDVAKERAALLPETASTLSQQAQDKMIDDRMTRNFDFLESLATTNRLPREVVDHVSGMLGDSAAGHFFIEMVSKAMTGGGRPQPGATIGQPGKPMTRAQLREELAKPEMQPGNPAFNQDAFDAINEKYRQLAR